MKVIILILIIATAWFFYNYQTSRCETAEDVMNKSIELMNHINNNKKDISINKLEAMMSKLNNIKALTDKQQACNAMSDIMDEL